MAVNIHTKTSPVGVDRKIQNLQNRFSSVMTSKWSLTSGDFYGRIYSEDEKEFIVPKHYKSSKEYKEVLFNDRVPVTMFFYVLDDEEQIGHNYFTSTVVSIWMVDLSKIKSSITHRADEEVKQDIMNVYNDDPFGFSETVCEKGNQAVFSDFNFKNKFINKQPRCALKFKSKVLYNYSNC